MKIKIVSTLVLLLIIHMSPFVSSCGPGRCGDPIEIFASVEKASVTIYSQDKLSYETIMVEPFDRRNLVVAIQLTYPDSLDQNGYSANHWGMIASVYATSPCYVFSDIQLTEYITDIQILSQDLVDESVVDITSDFLAGRSPKGLYLELEDYLAEGQRYGIGLVYKSIPTEDNQKWIVNTVLSDNRVLSDTIQFTLQ